VNPYDENAVEEAIRIKEKIGKGEVNIITIGPPRAEDAIRWCLAMGADNAFHIVLDDKKELDPWNTASILAECIKKMEYDLLLFGKKAVDDEMGQVGIFVAELLGLPVVSEVTRLELFFKERRVTVQRALEKGNEEIVECNLPSVFTVDKRLNRPRYPAFPSRKDAYKKIIHRIDLNSLDTLKDKKYRELLIYTIRIAPPKLGPKKILSPDSNLPAAGRMAWVMSGGISKKKGGVLGGDPEKLADGIIDFLKERKIISAN
jgi:electron transfer flavoprotein beta subunit